MRREGRTLGHKSSRIAYYFRVHISHTHNLQYWKHSQKCGTPVRRAAQVGKERGTCSICVHSLLANSLANCKDWKFALTIHIIFTGIFPYVVQQLQASITGNICSVAIQLCGVIITGSANAGNAKRLHPATLISPKGCQPISPF